MVVIHPVPNGNNEQTCSNQFQACYTDVRHWDELIDLNQPNCSPKAPYCLTATYKCNLSQEELEEEYKGLYAEGQMMNDRLYRQISYNSSFSNAFKFKLRQDVKLFLVEMKVATGKKFAEHVIRPVKVIPTSLVQGSYAPLQIHILGLQREPMKMKEWWMRRQVGKRLIVVLM